MVGCANPESGLRLFVQLPDRKRRHASNDSSASEDCKEICPIFAERGAAVPVGGRDRDGEMLGNVDTTPHRRSVRKQRSA